MQAISLLTIVILVAFFAKKEKSTYARLVIGSVFGILFFAVWPLVNFYINIFHFKEIYSLASYLIISIIAVVVSVTLVKIKKHELIVAGASLFCFLISMIFIYSNDKNIKNNIAIYTHYFNSTAQNKNIKNKENNRFLYHSENYTVSLNHNWIKQTDKGQFFDYFNLIKNNKIISEFRPKCTNKASNSIPETVENIKQMNFNKKLITKTNCYTTEKIIYACRVETLNQKKQIERIQWLSLNTKLKNEIELDFVIFNNHSIALDEIEKIINSATTKKTYKENTTCLSLAEWM